MLLLGCESAPQGREDVGLPGTLVQPRTVGSQEQHEANAAALSESEVALRRQMFARLVSDIRKYHVFSSVWPEAEWAKDLPVLEREVLGARDRDGLLLALCHVSNSLRDGHLAFAPCPGANGAKSRLMLPMTFTPVGSLATPRFLITHSERASGVAMGDVLLSYDGVPSEALLDHFRFELTGATRAARVNQLSELLRWRYALGREALGGTRVPMTVRHGAHVVRAEPMFRLGDSPPVPAPVNPGCPGPPREYDVAYELVAVGVNVCLYRASREPFREYPVVRHISFLYSPEQLAADHERVQAFLAATPHAGVVLDLRDNGGGTAADYVLPWYAARPFKGTSEWVHLHPELTDRARLERALRHDAAVDEYLRRAAKSETWWVRPFDCASGDCQRSETRQRRGRVTAAPITVLLGPGCRSSCDTFAAIWTRERFGPTIGTAPAAMYTSLRYPLAVELGDEPLGDFSIALCGLRFEDGEPWLEGRPLPVGSVVEPTWPKRDYEAKVLQTAVKALHYEQAFPSRVSSASGTPRAAGRSSGRAPGSAK